LTFLRRPEVPGFWPSNGVVLTIVAAIFITLEIELVCLKNGQRRLSARCCGQRL
jgi:hypothetical protein